MGAGDAKERDDDDKTSHSFDRDDNQEKGIIRGWKIGKREWRRRTSQKLKGGLAEGEPTARHSGGGKQARMISHVPLFQINSMFFLL